MVTLEMQPVEPQITAFNVPKEVTDILPELEGLTQSFVFEMMWQSRCEDEGQSCTSLEDVVDVIWTSVVKR
ncbi:hypothetical protein DPMN_053081 [Dreissena polymorpha]|uniref:Uncharacterized protein n=2 Tax=Dreissena polymorpha TaxID=45954 RepID=A0A9D4CKQ3_DREPO|nr:hypothetical protein DPMN_053081 [Dreissena polymorpha]